MLQVNSACLSVSIFLSLQNAFTRGQALHDQRRSGLAVICGYNVSGCWQPGRALVRTHSSVSARFEPGQCSPAAAGLGASQLHRDVLIPQRTTNRAAKALRFSAPLPPCSTQHRREEENNKTLKSNNKKYIIGLGTENCRKA